MTKESSFLFLGTGGSMGIPVIGCQCQVCQSKYPANQRFRSSGLLKIGEKKLLIDCGPDFRLQALKYAIDDIDGVILTHAHHDHTGGLDELRVYSIKHGHPLPCLMSKETADEVRMRYDYIFGKGRSFSKYTTKFETQLLEEQRGLVEFLGISFRYMTYEQSGMAVNGFCWNKFAYISDIRKYPEHIFEDLYGTKILVLSALRHTPSDFHFSVDEALEFSQKVGAAQTWLTHIAHELDHEETNNYLPPNVRMAYDGLEICLGEDENG